MSRSVKPKFILVIDWETTGTTWSSFEETFQQYQGITFGAIIADAETLEPVETLYREIKYDPKYKWSGEAEAIHGKSQAYLEEYGVTSEEAALDLATLIVKYFGVDGKVMFAGHNTWFDIHATRQLLAEFGVMPQLHHVVLDSSVVAFVCIGEYKSDVVFELLAGISRDKHNALDDAMATLKALKSCRELVNAGLYK